jgi:hypothetical protein
MSKAAQQYLPELYEADTARGHRFRYGLLMFDAVMILFNPLPTDSETWLHDASYHEGSWWTDWANWIGEFGGGRSAAG